MVEAGQMYRHYKGHIYRVIGLALHSESLETLVVYERADSPEPHLWVRPQTMFEENLSDGRPRFERLLKDN